MLIGRDEGLADLVAIGDDAHVGDEVTNEMAERGEGVTLVTPAGGAPPLAAALDAPRLAHPAFSSEKGSLVASTASNAARKKPFCTQRRPSVLR